MKENTTRRDFITGLGVAGTLMAAGGLALTGCGNAGGAGTNQAGDEGSVSNNAWDRETDVLVVGGGVGGVYAALNAQSKGANVILLEAWHNLGGTAQISGGALHIFGAKSSEEFLKSAKECNPEFAQIIPDVFNNELIPFTSETGAPHGDKFMLPPAAQSVYGVEYWDCISYQPNPEGGRAFYDYLQQYLEDKGGEILLNTRGYALITNDTGAVVGGEAATTDTNEKLRIKAKAVVLATGGFANNKGLKNLFLGPWGDRTVARTLPYNNGAGLMMGLAAGAVLSGNFGTFYGHTAFYPPQIPQDPESFANEDILKTMASCAAIQQFIQRCNVLNVQGERFFDESLNDDNFVQKILYQEQGKALLVCDAAIMESYGGVSMGGANYMNMPKVELYETLSAGLKKADTLEELFDQVAEWGYSRYGIQTIQEFNEAIDNGTNLNLKVPRKGDLLKIATPPFYAFEVTSGISHTYGGLKLSTKAEVLGKGDLPIPGLYADGGVAGGIYYYYYGGSVALAGTVGFIAGASAAEYVASLA